MEEFKKTLKEYENIRQRMDPIYEDWVAAIDIVKQFIRDRKLVIYGGSAIDYALRIHGDKIYPDSMLTVPDLDFFSPNSVQDAYDLADLLYSEGFEESRAIRALYVRAMKVDIGDKHFVADIAYCPAEIFARMEYLEYDGMRVIHPIYQRLDMHSALAFPYDMPPTEAIFNRWKKDIERFWLLDKYFPTKDIYHTTAGELEVGKLRLVRAPIVTDIIGGFAAFYAIYDHFRAVYGDIPELLRLIGLLKFDEDCPQLSDMFAIRDGKMLYPAASLCLDVLSHKPRKTAEKLKLRNLDYYEPYFNIQPARINGEITNECKVFVSSTKHRLLSINSLRVGDQAIRIANSQYVARQMLALGLSSNGAQRNTYLIHYDAMMTMIKHATANYDTIRGSKSPLALSVDTYGSDNISLSMEISINSIMTNRFAAKLETEQPQQLQLPRNYMVALSKRNGYPMPAAETSSHFFRESGKAIDPGDETMIEHLF